MDEEAGSDDEVKKEKQEEEQEENCENGALYEDEWANFALKC